MTNDLKNQEEVSSVYLNHNDKKIPYVNLLRIAPYDKCSGRPVDHILSAEIFVFL